MRQIIVVCVLAVLFGPGFGAFASSGENGIGAVSGVAQNDADGGGDAPNGPAAEVWIIPGVRYQGNVSGALGDPEDWYAFQGLGGQQLHLRTFSPKGLCMWSMHGEDGQQIEADRCLLQIRPDFIEYQWTVPTDGIHFLRIGTLVEPVHYRFAFAFDGAAPSPV